MRTKQTRRGTIVPVMALCVTGLFGFVALAVDLGILAVTRTQCQNAADAAALAGARQLDNASTSVNNNATSADTQARGTVTSNRQLNAQFTAGNIAAVDIGTYTYNTSTQKFVTSFTGTKAASDSWTAVRVNLTADQPMFFAKILGIQSMPTGASAVAVHRPRDIALVLDFSGSMYFGSLPNWEPGYGNSNGVVRGLMNPDDNYPKFGHYGRYTAYDPAVTVDPNNVTAATNAGSPAARPNPLQRTGGFTLRSGEYTAPNNYTVEGNGGPPMMFDFRFNPSNIGSPGTAAAATGTMWNAFHRWFPATPTDTPDLGLSVVDRGNPYKYGTFKPTVQSLADQGTWVKRTFDWTGYDPFDTTNTKGPTPAPDFFDTQADDATSGVAYTGDRYARKNGVVRTLPTSWDAANADGAAVNLIDYLNWAGGYSAQAPRRSAASSGSGTTFRPGLNLSPNTNEYASDWSTFRDAAWERYGYDLDVADYVANRGATWDPRWDWDITGNSWQHARPIGFTTANAFRPKRVAAAERFKGYVLGPGYWGKTFAVYPPDPRWGGDVLGTVLGGGVQPQTVSSSNPVKDTNGNWIADWRRRFFLKTDGSAFADADNISGTLFNNSASGLLRVNGYRVNYPAVLAWLKSGPQMLPPNLRSGRMLYYSRIPDDATSTTDLDECFWRGYINFVIGYDNGSSNFDYEPQNNLAGVEYRGWPEGATVLAGRTTAGYAHGQFGVLPADDPAAYLNYADNPSRPRAHLWFGPQSMLMYLYARSPRNQWMSGTAREAQTWQLKAAVNSALEDIRVNHPNDWCGMAYFASSNFSTPRASTGQDWSKLKNSLFYPNSMLTGGSPLINTVSNELRPYNASLNETLVGNLPNANGGTDPNTGMALAYNLLSSSTSLSGTDYPTKGRRGAAKIVIFETDGVPNATPNWSLTNSGYNTHYRNSGGTPLWGGETRNVNGANVSLDSSFTFNANAANAALGIVKQICDLESSSSQGGHSTANTPARVYPIAFGDLFSGYNGTYASVPTSQAQDAIKFLTRASQLGNTGTWSTSYILPTTSVITGNYADRIDNMRTTLERIMQSGVQVTLIQ